MKFYLSKKNVVIFTIINIFFLSGGDPDVS